MNYIGSKTSLLSFLDHTIESVVHGQGCRVFCDLFAGTGAVGRWFKTKGYQVIANDLQYYSYVLNKQYIETIQVPIFSQLKEVHPQLFSTSSYEQVFQYLNTLPGKEGFIYQHYAAGGTRYAAVSRQYFSDENALKCDAIRQEIEYWKAQALLTETEYFFLLASLIEAIDKVANTASVYGAFLKQLKKTAQEPLVLVPAACVLSGEGHRVFNQDANQLIKTISTDILYLDPPYNHRQYAANYHLLETIARYDAPELYGDTGLRKAQDQRSTYSLKSKVKDSFTDLILNAKAKFIFLSYNNEGLLSLEDIQTVMSLRGDYRVFTQPHSRYKADKNRGYKAHKTLEYLHGVKVKAGY